jgi:hypothetical protein
MKKKLSILIYKLIDQIYAWVIDSIKFNKSFLNFFI